MVWLSATLGETLSLQVHSVKVDVGSVRVKVMVEGPAAGWESGAEAGFEFIKCADPGGEVLLGIKSPGGGKSAGSRFVPLHIGNCLRLRSAVLSFAYAKATPVTLQTSTFQWRSSARARGSFGRYTDV